jgi:serine/threonine protein kinase
MLEKLKEAERYNETDAANTVHKIVDALVYLHSKGIAHRDLKVRLPLAMLNCVYPLALYCGQQCLIVSRSCSRKISC